MKHNKKAYQLKEIVGYYSRLTQLQKPEKTILHLLGSKLKEKRVLDIGVGAGRTSPFFSKGTKEYIGIDYSKNMIDECRRRFSSDKKLTFMVCDVRNMKLFKNNYFDFILCSFNGLDYIFNRDRLRALKEIKRVGKNGQFLSSRLTIYVVLKNYFQTVLV